MKGKRVGTVVRMLLLAAVTSASVASVPAQARHQVTRKPLRATSSDPRSWRRESVRPAPYQGWISIEPRRWPPDAAPQVRKAVPLTGPSRPGPDPAAICVARLAALGIEAEAAARPSAIVGPCVVPVPVRLLVVRAPPPLPAVRIAGALEIDCSMAERFGSFTREILAPLAVGTMSTPLASLSAGGFACRPVDGLGGAKPSPHATGIAVDVMSFTFEDGRRLDIGKAETFPAQIYFKAIRAAACGYFTTVLGPGTDPFHATHLHVDLKRHGNDDHYRICE